MKIFSFLTDLQLLYSILKNFHGLSSLFSVQSGGDYTSSSGFFRGVVADSNVDLFGPQSAK